MMKTKHGNDNDGILLLLLLLLLPISLSAAPVLDIHGNQVRAGFKYYILPAIRGRGGGGLTLAPATPNNSTSCPLAVVQEHSELRNGLPVTFSPVDNKKNLLVRLSTDNNIKFTATPTSISSCVQYSTVWKLDGYDQSTGKYFITTGGVRGNPGPQTISNWFKIEKLQAAGAGAGDYNYYKLVFCPTVCNFCKVICRDIGIFNRRLALTDDQPFPISFKKAP